jgi:hypothetical protein
MKTAQEVVAAEVLEGVGEGLDKVGLLDGGDGSY